MTTGAGDDVPDIRAAGEQLARNVGARIRVLRTAKGWSRAELAARVPSGVGPATIALYETGGRIMSFPRLVEVMETLGAEPGVELDRCRAGDHITAPMITVNLRALQDAQHPLLRKLRPWATTRLAAGTTGRAGTVAIPTDLLAELAALLKCGVEDLVDAFTALPHMITAGEQRILSQLAAGGSARDIATTAEFNQLYRKLGVVEARKALARATETGVPFDLPTPPDGVDRASFDATGWRVLELIAAGEPNHRVVHHLHTQHGMDRLTARTVIETVIRVLGQPGRVHAVGLALALVAADRHSRAEGC